ncbi:polymerase delta-interacting protein 3-like [Culicoides brevitarsis]|uniref:polymerase delta-interacting protein 3-like n=1 Tax=Culicoides brevitarsis TaxID=469753 RepID=UPI00307C8224
MDKSLDEIIKATRVGKKQKPGNNGRTPTKKGVLNKKPFGNKKSPGKGPAVKRLNQKASPARPLGDARAKIAQKTRSKITDARVLLTKKQRTRPAIPPGGLKTRKNRVKVPQMMADDDDDMMMDEDMDFDGPAPVLRRTVKNNYVLPRTLATMPPLPTFSRTVETDPFDCYLPYERPPVRPAPPMYKPEPVSLLPDDPYTDLYDEPSPRKGILRGVQGNSPSRKASNALKSRLYSKPDPRAPSGIFGRDRDPDREFHAAPPAAEASYPNGFRIVVSNLHTSVSQSDIQELFEDIGPLLESRLVRPGVAEVIFKRLADAENAVETYHNRQLDGQPMKCLLVRQRNMSFKTQSSQHPANKMPLDLDTVHKVLFKR